MLICRRCARGSALGKLGQRYESHLELAFVANSRTIIVGKVRDPVTWGSTVWRRVHVGTGDGRRAVDLRVTMVTKHVGVSNSVEILGSDIDSKCDCSCGVTQ